MPKTRTMQEITSSDKEWQKLRESLVGTWMKHAPENVRKLRHYLGNLRTTTNEKLIIVLNYLVGTGFRTGRIKHSDISKLRKEITEEIRLRKEEKRWHR